jgi:hypothetical protein
MAIPDWIASHPEIVGLVLLVGVLCAPLYLILQAWFGYAWAGRWRIAALIPLAGLVAFACLDIRQPVGFGDLLAAVVLFAPVGLSYLVIAGIAYLIAAIANRMQSRPTTA